VQSALSRAPGIAAHHYPRMKSVRLLVGWPRFDSARPSYGPKDQRIIRRLADIRFVLGFFYQSAATHLLFNRFCKCPVLDTKNALFLATLWATRKRFFGMMDALFPEQIQKEEGEIMRLKTILWALYLTCSLAGSMACNTVHGMGQDIERGGEKTQDAADAVKRRM